MTETPAVYGTQKPVKHKNKKYMAWIDLQPCLVCGLPSTHCHVRRPYWGAGVGLKPHDLACIPLCHRHHSYENERKYGTDRQIAELLMRYIQEKL